MLAEPYMPTEADIRTWVGDQSFSRGHSYQRDGAITNPRRQGDTLRAQCFGSTPQPYRVEVTLGDDGIIADRCSCPLGGRCKHVAALLLTWLHDDQAFVEVEEIHTALNKRTKEELIALIVRMVQREPDLETLLELPMPGVTQGSKAIDPKLIERQVKQAFQGMDYEYGASAAAASQLEQICELGKQYAATGDWRNAALVYHTVAEGALENYEFDEEGELGTVAGACAEGLSEGLAAVSDPDLREIILRYLFDLFRWEIEAGGYDLGVDIPGLMTAQTSPAEKQAVARWVRAAMPKNNGDGGWSSQALGGFLLNLEAETLDDESYLRICRQSGRTGDLIDRLLTLGRSDEAMQSAQRVNDYELLTLEQTFGRHNQIDLFVRLIASRAPSSQDTRIKDWLRKYVQEQGDLDQALTLTQELFWASPSLYEYGRLKQLATQLERWPALQAGVLARLGKEPRYHDLLTRIHLEDGQIDQALELARRPPSLVGWVGGFGASQLGLDVARAAEESRPQAAIELYTQHVQRLINVRNRDSYAAAAGFLLRMKPLFQRLNQETDWRKLVADIRANNPRLRALQDELAKARL